MRYCPRCVTRVNGRARWIDEENPTMLFAVATSDASFRCVQPKLQKIIWTRLAGAQSIIAIPENGNNGMRYPITGKIQFFLAAEPAAPSRRIAALSSHLFCMELKLLA